MSTSGMSRLTAVTGSRPSHGSRNTTATTATTATTPGALGTPTGSTFGTPLGLLHDADYGQVQSLGAGGRLMDGGAQEDIPEEGSSLGEHSGAHSVQHLVHGAQSGASSGDASGQLQGAAVATAVAPAVAAAGGSSAAEGSVRVPLGAHPADAGQGAAAAAVAAVAATAAAAAAGVGAVAPHTFSHKQEHEEGHTRRNNVRQEEEEEDEDWGVPVGAPYHGPLAFSFSSRMSLFGGAGTMIPGRRMWRTFIVQEFCTHGALLLLLGLCRVPRFWGFSHAGYARLHAVQLCPPPVRCLIACTPQSYACAAVLQYC